jgi:hypothetical protein
MFDHHLSKSTKGRNTKSKASKANAPTHKAWWNIWLSGKATGSTREHGNLSSIWSIRTRLWHNGTPLGPIHHLERNKVVRQRLHPTGRLAPEGSTSPEPTHYNKLLISLRLYFRNFLFFSQHLSLFDQSLLHLTSTTLSSFQRGVL